MGYQRRPNCRRFSDQAGRCNPEPPRNLLWASPRATLALYKTSQALAAIQNRDHVLPDDIKYLAIPVLSHRLKLKPEAELRGRTSIDIIKQILSETPLKLSDQDRKGD